MSSYLVTGGNRGIGLELVNQLSALPASQVSAVFATSRSEQPPAPLQKLIDSSNGRVIHVQMQITEPSSVEKVASQVDKVLAGKGLDVLINNAGIMPISPGGTAAMKNADLQEAFAVNVEAVHNVTTGFLPSLRKGQEKKVVNM